MSDQYHCCGRARAFMAAHISRKAWLMAAILVGFRSSRRVSCAGSFRGWRDEYGRGPRASNWREIEACQSEFNRWHSAAPRDRGRSWRTVAIQPAASWLARAAQRSSDAAQALGWRRSGAGTRGRRCPARHSPSEVWASTVAQLVSCGSSGRGIPGSSCCP